MKFLHTQTKLLTMKPTSSIVGHKDILEGDSNLKQRLDLRDSCVTTLNVCQAYTVKRIRHHITTLNVCQAYTVKRIRHPSFNMKARPHISKEIIESSKPVVVELASLNPTSEYATGLEDTLILTIKGIAAGM
ncbi:Phosphoenolpyruvate carboxylase [Dillenia turbinata]|uniref:Phosphoenolpyruvate carboxylase n=1 Tax=Dillenia turbinata TaxID=194707 RepID=A0AAN8YX77_9MAGN